MTATPQPEGLAPRLIPVSDGGGGPARVVVLVLAGGRAHSRARVRPWQLAQLRMVPIARAARSPGVPVWRLRYRVRGWNAPWSDPVRDTRWALAELTQLHPAAAILLVGHSMGGRTALRCADDPAVAGVLALAPWLEPGEPIVLRPAVGVLIAHGDRDRITDPAASSAFAARAAAAGLPVRFLSMPGSAHAMLRRAGQWHALVRSAVAELLAAQARA